MLFLDLSSVGVFQLAGLFHSGEVCFTSVALLLMNKSFYIVSALQNISGPHFSTFMVIRKAVVTAAFARQDETQCVCMRKVSEARTISALSVWKYVITDYCQTNRLISASHLSNCSILLIYDMHQLCEPLQLSL